MQEHFKSCSLWTLFGIKCHAPVNCALFENPRHLCQMNNKSDITRKVWVRNTLIKKDTIGFYIQPSTKTKSILFLAQLRAIYIFIHHSNAVHNCKFSYVSLCPLSIDVKKETVAVSYDAIPLDRLDL